MRQGLQLAVLLLCGAAVASARLINDDTSPTRSLLQQGCPAECVPGKCRSDPNLGSVCIQCANNMVEMKFDGTCGCLPGFYKTGSGTGSTCVKCERGYYCPALKAFSYARVACGTTQTTGNGASAVDGITTVGKGSKTKDACVNKPGYFFSVSNGLAVGTACTNSTFSTGYTRQPACTPCDSGFQIDPALSGGFSDRRSSRNCVAPPGYFVASPGKVAACAQGEYKTGYTNSAACSTCGDGVTTRAKASTARSACQVLKPGYYAATVSANDTTGYITQTYMCPQGYYCEGGAGDATTPPTVLDTSNLASPPSATRVIKCGTAAWTQGLGATKASECLVPPGYGFKTGTVQKCDAGSYRSGWVPVNSTTALCTDCSTDGSILTTDNTYIVQYNVSSGMANSNSTADIAVSTGSDACTLKPGWGMYTTGRGGFKAVKCNNNNYGASATSYGLRSIPCKTCPTGTETHTNTAPSNTSYDGTNDGFTDPLACVTKVGYGYDGTVATPCAKGYINAGNNYDKCTECGFGLTTDGTGKTGCVVKAGYGYNSVELVYEECPVGAYNQVNTSLATSTTACVACAGNTTTGSTASDSINDCDLCAAGFGGASAAACAPCGGVNASATYGPSTRTDNETLCIDCPVSAAGYSFIWGGVNVPYMSVAISKSNADSPADCFALYTQVEDQAWELEGANTTDAATTLATCAAACSGATDCMFMTFSYVDTQCKLRLATGLGKKVGFKIAPSGDVTAGSVVAAAVSSGAYAVYDDSLATAIGTTNTTGTATTAADCFSECDASATCAAVIMVGTPSSLTCNLVIGKNDLTTGMRSLVRADVAKITATW